MDLDQDLKILLLKSSGPLKAHPKGLEQAWAFC